MAETVEKNVEEMLTELEQMKRVKLFDENEINMILKQRRHFEYLLQKKKKKVKDFQAYINHEVRVLALLKIRRCKIGYGFKKDDIEMPIMSRLERLHRLLCHRFPSSLTHWVAHIKLLESFGKCNAVNKTWTKCFQLHPTAEPKMWISCVNWLLHRRPDIETPRKVKSIIVDKKELIWKGKHATKKMNALMKNKDLSVEDIQDLTSAVETEIQQVSYRYRLAGFREARIVLTQGIQNQPNSQELCRELVKLEALHTDYLKFSFKSGLRRVIDLLDIEEDLSSIESGALLKVVLDEVLSKWPNDLSFIESLVEIVDNIPSLTGCPAINDLHTRHTELLEEAESSRKHPELDGVKDEISKSDKSLLEMMEIGHNGEISDVETFYRQQQNNIKQKVTYELFGCYIDALITRLTVLDEDDMEADKLRRQIRKAFQFECDNWGKNTVDYWLKYMSFEEKYGDPLKVAELHHRAGKQLPQKLFCEVSFARSHQDH